MMKAGHSKYHIRTGGTRRPGRGFTLIEILIVVIILGIIAAIVIPNVSDASIESKENMLKENLRVLRTQINTYRAQHWDVAPGYPNGDNNQNPTEETFIAQMTLSSNAYGQTAPVNTPGFPYGPYFRAMPSNPVNSLNSIQVVIGSLPNDGDDNFAWIYSPDEVAICAANTGLDRAGDSYYIDY